MTFEEMVMTISGGAIFAFLVIMLWGKFVTLWGVIGGYLAAMLIPGTMWIINHGLSTHFIKQTGSVWIDMTWAVGIGAFISSKIQGGKVLKAKSTIGAVIVGGIISGYILTRV